MVRGRGIVRAPTALRHCRPRRATSHTGGIDDPIRSKCQREPCAHASTPHPPLPPTTPSNCNERLLGLTRIQVPTYSGRLSFFFIYSCVIFVSSLGEIQEVQTVRDLERALKFTLTSCSLQSLQPPSNRLAQPVKENGVRGRFPPCSASPHSYPMSPYSCESTMPHCHIRPYPLENSGSRLLSHRQASEGQTSSWVGDDQRIPGVVCFLL